MVLLNNDMLLIAICVYNYWKLFKISHWNPCALDQTALSEVAGQIAQF